MSSSRHVVVIMAGGSGERFWPLSRRNRPKQLLHLTSPDRSLLQESVDRLLPLLDPGDIYVVTGRHLQDAIVQADTGLPPENILAEPCKRNTSGCLAYAAARIQAMAKDPQQSITMGVVTADHQIANPEEFRASVKAAMDVADNSGALVTMGIRPTRPEIGYGYIEMPPDASPIEGSDSIRPAFPVVRFREKPDRESAARYLATGLFLWNSGMFFWRISSFINEFRQTAPAFADAIEQMREAMRAGDEDRVDELFAGLDDISIDYALLEGAKHVATLPAAFGWDDVGAWDALDRTYPTDENENVAVGDPVLLDSHNCVVYNEPGAENMAVAVVGMANLVVVTRQDAVLVARKSHVQDVKAALKELKNRGAPQV
ncbi:MAG: mannose-1-phosphate guanylyltransferase [Verrucomicrobiota bacterium]